MRALVVEDEVSLARTVQRGLISEGFVCDLAHDGIVGLAMATYGGYDVVVLDIMLPGIHGYDVLAQLRAREVWTPVLMLTAKDGEFDQTDAFDLGADDYLTKPFAFPVLVARLRALMRRGSPVRPVTLACGSLTLDPVSRRVTRRGAAVDLTPREYLLLQCFMQRPGEALSKEEILAHVWDSDYPGSDNVVEVYVGYLRRKIDAPFGLTTLQTVRGVGYRLVADDPPPGS